MRSKKNDMLMPEKRKFIKLMNDWAVSLGGIPEYAHNDSDTGCPTAQYTVKTQLGDLTISPHGDWVACRWLDVAKAVAVIGRYNMNHFSGKWNHHIFTRVSGQEAFEYVTKQIEPYLIKPAEQVSLQKE